jgi:hypothetical protein
VAVSFRLSSFFSERRVKSWFNTCTVRRLSYQEGGVRWLGRFTRVVGPPRLLLWNNTYHFQTFEKFFAIPVYQLRLLFQSLQHNANLFLSLRYAPQDPAPVANEYNQQDWR